MHELAITRNIVAIVAERAEGRTVRRVRLEVGALSGVVPEAIRFCFDVVARGTVLEGAELEIIDVPGRGRCRSCGESVALEGLIGRCTCGSSALDIVAGEELKIKDMELDMAANVETA